MFSLMSLCSRQQNVGMETDLLRSGCDARWQTKIDVKMTAAGSEANLKEYSMDEVSDHCTPQSCWMVIKDKVYDVTSFIKEHPGGEEILLENAGRDSTTPFTDKRHSQYAYGLLEKYCIGILVEEERLES